MTEKSNDTYEQLLKDIEHIEGKVGRLGRITGIRETLELMHKNNKDISDIAIKIKRYKDIIDSDKDVCDAIRERNAERDTQGKKGE